MFLFAAFTIICEEKKIGCIGRLLMFRSFAYTVRSCWSLSRRHALVLSNQNTFDKGEGFLGEFGEGVGGCINVAVTLTVGVVVL